MSNKFVEYSSFFCFKQDRKQHVARKYPFLQDSFCLVIQTPSNSSFASPGSLESNKLWKPRVKASDPDKRHFILIFGFFLIHDLSPTKFSFLLIHTLSCVYWVASSHWAHKTRKLIEIFTKMFLRVALHFFKEHTETVLKCLKFYYIFLLVSSFILFFRRQTRKSRSLIHFKRIDN